MYASLLSPHHLILLVSVQCTICAKWSAKRSCAKLLMFRFNVNICRYFGVFVATWHPWTFWWFKRRGSQWILEANKVQPDILKLMHTRAKFITFLMLSSTHTNTRIHAYAYKNLDTHSFTHTNPISSYLFLFRFHFKSSSYALCITTYLCSLVCMYVCIYLYV